MKTLHARDCSFNATDTPDGDFCDCVPVVEMSVKDYNAMYGRLTRLEAAVLEVLNDPATYHDVGKISARLEHALAAGKEE